MRSWLFAVCLVLVGAAYIARAQDPTSTSEPAPEPTTEPVAETTGTQPASPEPTTTKAPNGCPSMHNLPWIASSLVFSYLLCALL